MRRYRYFFFFLRDSQLSEGEDIVFIEDENSVVRSINKSWENRFVAHSLGGLAGGVIYSNSLEAFLANYRGGFRFFEVDLSLTSNNTIVAFHDGLEKYIGLKQKIWKIKHKKFMSKKYLGHFTLLDSDGLLALLEQYPDVYFIIDVKTIIEIFGSSL